MNEAPLRERLLQTALKIHEKYGLYVSPFKIEKREDGKFEKTPLMKRGDLDRWLRFGQTVEEIQNMNWDKANGIGVYCYKTKDGLFFCCLDLDMGEDEWRPLLKFLPVTKLEKTPRNGLHAFFLSETEPQKTITIKNGSNGVELLYKKWVIIHPSHRYEKLNDNSPKKVKSAVQLFLDFIEKAGYSEYLTIGNNAETFANGDNGHNIEKYLKGVEDFLRPRLSYDGGYYALYRCPFHPPDNHASLYLRRDKGYIHDFHDGATYSLKDFLKKVGVNIDGNGKDGGVFSVHDLSRFLENVGGVEYICNPLLPRGALILLAGRPGSGKSFITLDMALCISSGKPIFNFYQTEKHRVLLIDLENPPTLLKERALLLQKNRGVGETFLLSGPFYLDIPRHVKMLEQIITEKRVGVVIIDNLTACFQKLQNENESLRLYRIMKSLKDIAVKSGATFVLVHHLRKPGQFTSANPLDEVRGSSVIVGIADMVYVLQKIQDFYQLQVVKNRVSTFNETLLLELQHGGFQLLQKGVETPSRLNEVVRFIETTANNMPNGVFSVKSLKESSHFSRRELYSGLQFLMGVGKVKRVARGLYQYVLQSSLEDVELSVNE